MLIVYYPPNPILVVKAPILQSLISSLRCPRGPASAGCGAASSAGCEKAGGYHRGLNHYLYYLGVRCNYRIMGPKTLF